MKPRQLPRLAIPGALIAVSAACTTVQDPLARVVDAPPPPGADAASGNGASSGSATISASCGCDPADAACTVACAGTMEFPCGCDYAQPDCLLACAELLQIYTPCGCASDDMACLAACDNQVSDPPSWPCGCEPTDIDCLQGCAPQPAPPEAPCPCPMGDFACERVCAALSDCQQDADRTDRDGDGWFLGCDCDDDDPDAHPAQVGHFVYPRITSATGAGEMPMSDGMPTYDYDCDGGETARILDVAVPCDPLPNAGACLGSGWVSGAMPPDCGQPGVYQACVLQDGACLAEFVTLTQACR